MIYVARVESGPRAGLYKVGFTTIPAGRMKSLGIECQGSVTLLALFPGTQREEHALHKALAPSRADIPPATEYYRAAPEFMAWLAGIAAEHRCDVLRPWPDGRGAKGSRFWHLFAGLSRACAAADMSRLYTPAPAVRGAA